MAVAILLAIAFAATACDRNNAPQDTQVEGSTATPTPAPTLTAEVAPIVSLPTPTPTPSPTPTPTPTPEEVGEVQLSITFDDASWEAYESRITAGAQVSGERVADFGRTDNYSYRITNTTGDYASGAGNFITINLPQPLLLGGTYNLSFYVYIPEDRNHDKENIPGAGIVFNSTFGSPANQPTNANDLTRRTPMDEWTQTTTTFTIDHTSGQINSIVFRFRVNDPAEVPTVWYIDDITITLLEMEEMIEPVWDMTLPSLREAWADYFIIGSIMEPSLINNNPRNVREMFLLHYGAVTAENAMKTDAISGGGNTRNRPASLHLNGAETVVRFAEENDLFMVGHTLAWHSQTAPWFTNHPETGEPLTRTEAKENMRWFIENYAGHFEGRVHAWDVTNEVFTGGGGANLVGQGPEGSTVYPVGSWQRALRNYVPWYHAFANGADIEAGESASDYVYYAFVFARRYAPSALLIYNDFNEWFNHKRNAMANMTIELNERWHNDSVNNPAYGDPSHPDYGRLLIEVIGMQGHISAGANLQDIYRALELFSQTGARIHITELDLTFPNTTGRPMVMTPEEERRQADMYAQLFVWFREFSDYIDRITFWGREDSSSWRSAQSPLLFDRFFRPKDAFWAVLDPEGWLAQD